MRDVSPNLQVVPDSVFDPAVDERTTLPDAPATYIACLRPGIDLPKTNGEPVYTDLNGHRVLYIGTAKKSLRRREYVEHFEADAGRSTLRKSLGVLFGYNMIPRDRKFAGSRKTKFNPDSEQQLSTWMKQSLVLFWAAAGTPTEMEKALIVKFDPPLNLDRNRNTVNWFFRERLKTLRSLGLGPKAITP